MDDYKRFVEEKDTLDEVLKTQKLLWNELKEKKRINQDLTAKWIVANSNGVEVANKTKIQGILTSEDKKAKQKWLKDQLLSLYKFMENRERYDLERFIHNYKKKAELKSWQQRVHDFIFEQHKKLEKQETLIIEACGVKLGSLLSGLELLDKEKLLSKIECKCVIINPNGPGMKTRKEIEGSRKENSMVVQGGIDAWRQFKSDLISKKIEHKFNFRLLNINPSFYMIRIGNKMFVNQYFSEKGYFVNFSVIDNVVDKELYNAHLKNFKRYFESDRLSQDMDWSPKNGIVMLFHNLISKLKY